MAMRRYRVVKYSKVTGNMLPTSAPEAQRRFWTERGALQESRRLNRIAWKSGLPYRFQAERV